MEQKEWATIEEDITQLRNEIRKLTEEMNHQGDDFVRFRTTRSMATEHV